MKRLAALDRVTALAVALLALMLGAALFVPMFARHDPLAIGDVLALRLVPPFGRDSTGAWHLLGTDRFGRDLFVRMMLAARCVTRARRGRLGSLAAAIGTLAGAGRGTGLGRDHRSCDDGDRGRAARHSAPRAAARLRRALAYRACSPCSVADYSAQPGWMGVHRADRAHGEVLGVRARPFVEAARALGVSHWRVLWRHVAAKCDRSHNRCDDAWRGQRDPARERPLFPRTWHPAPAAELGQYDRGRARSYSCRRRGWRSRLGWR